MSVLVVQSLKERTNRITDFADLCHPRRVLWAPSVSEGIRIIRSSRPRVVIVDVDIENGSGFRVFEETPEMHYEKIIVASTPGMAMKCIRHHVSGYVLKPLRTAELRLAVQTCIGRLANPGIRGLFEAFCSDQAEARVTHLFVGTPEHSRIIVEVSHISAVQDTGPLRVLHMDYGAPHHSTDSLQFLSKSLSGNAFIRIPGEALIQRSHVTAIAVEHHSTVIVLRSGQVLTLSSAAASRLEGF